MTRVLPAEILAVIHRVPRAFRSSCMPVMRSSAAGVPLADSATPMMPTSARSSTSRSWKKPLTLPGLPTTYTRSAGFVEMQALRTQ